MEKYCMRHGFGTRFTTATPNEKVKATHARSIETLLRGWKIEYLCKDCCDAGLYSLDRYSMIYDAKELIHGLPGIPCIPITPVISESNTKQLATSGTG